MNRAFTTLCLAGLLLPLAAAADRYHTPLAAAGWDSVPGGNACHLVHRLPRLGTVILSQYRDDRLVTTFVTRRPPGAKREGRLYREATAWQPAARERVATVRAVPERNALRFGQRVSALLLSGLEAGDEMRLSFADWQVGPLDAVLSPVAFRPALRRHLACLAGDAEANGARDASVGSGNPGEEAGAGTGGQAVTRSRGAASRNAHARETDAAVTIRGVGTGGVTRLYFGHGTARLDRIDFEALRRLAATLRGAGHLSEVVIVGHTDSTGGRAHNEALGLARAIEVRNRLISEGVAPQRLAVRSAGESAPVAGNDDRYERSRNRRVVIETGP